MGSAKGEGAAKVLTEEDLGQIAAREGLVADDNGQFSLEQLVLERNHLTSLGTAFRAFPFIQHLDLSRNNLRSLQGVEYLPNLRKLSLYYNQIEGMYSLDVIKAMVVDGSVDGKELFALKEHMFLEELDLRLNAITRAELYRFFVVQHLPRLKILDQRTIREQERQRIEGAPKIAPSDLFAEEYEEFENKEYVTDNDEISHHLRPRMSTQERNLTDGTTSSDAKDPSQDLREDSRELEETGEMQREAETRNESLRESETEEEIRENPEGTLISILGQDSLHLQSETTQSSEDILPGSVTREEAEAKTEAVPPLPSTVGQRPLNISGSSGSPQRDTRRQNGSPTRSAPRPPQRGRTSSSGGVWWRAQVADYPEETDEVGDEGEADTAKELNRVDALLDQLSNNILTMQAEPGDAELWQQSIMECREVLEEIAFAREEEVKGQKNEILQLRAQNERSLDQLRVRMQSSVIPRLAEADEGRCFTHALMLVHYALGFRRGSIDGRKKQSQGRVRLKKR